MRLKQYIEGEYNIVDGMMLPMLYGRIDETSDTIFDIVKSLGKKVGLKIKKSDTIFNYIKRAGKGVEDLLRYSTLYGMTDIRDTETKDELVKDMKNTLKKVSKKEVIAFFMQLDRGFIGLTSIPRHVLMSLFGIEISTTNKHMDDITYIQKEVRHIKKTLKKMGGTEKELKLITQFEISMENIGK